MIKGAIAVDKFEFMGIVAEQFEGLKTNEEIDKRAEQMIKLIEQSRIMAKGYLKAEIL